MEYKKIERLKKEQVLMDLLKEEMIDLDELYESYEPDKHLKDEIYRESVIRTKNVGCAMAYLIMHDPSLKRSMALVLDRGYPPENYDSRLLASTLIEYDLTEKLEPVIRFLR